MLKMTIDNEEVVSDKDITINEEMLSASSTILNNVYPKEWEEDKDYTSKFYYPQDYSKALIQRSYVTQEAEAGTTIQVNGSATLTDVDTTKNSRVLRLLGQTSQTGTPTPSSPIPVNVVSGDNEIVVCGKNLLNIKNYTLSGNAIVVNEVDDYKLSYTTSSSSAEQMIFFNDIELKAGVTYTAIRTKASTMASNNGALELYQNLTWKKVILNASSNTGTFTVDTDGIYRIRIKIANYNQTPYSGTISDIMISTIGGTYEPYIGNTYNIDLPVENLFDKDNANYVNGWIDGTTMRLNTINGNRMFYIPCKPNTTYTISRSIITSSFRITTYDSTPFPTATSSNVNYTVPTVIQNNSGTTLTITTNANAKYLVVHYGKIEDTNLNEMLATIQVEYGSKANSYTPYGTTPIELCKIGTYQDYFYKDSDKWYLHKEIKKLVLNGSESWNYSLGNAVFYSDVIKPFAIPSNFLCNYYEKIDNSITFGNMTNGTAKYENNVNGRLIIKDTRYTNVNDYTTWLSTHNVTLYYVLSTPTNIEITYESLIEQLNALSSQ